jgi:chromosome segregation ATPase
VNDGIVQIALYAVGGCLLGACVSWTVQSVRSKRRISQLAGAAQGKLDEVVAQRNKISGKLTRSQSRLEHLEAVAARQSAKLESLLQKARLLAENVRILRKEREDTKSKLGTLQNALVSLKRQSSDLQTEFDKTREFYKRELLKSLQKRKSLEEDIVKARAEQEAFARAVESSVLEHGSKEDMVIAAQLRLGQLEVLERTVNKLEAENDQLRADAQQIKQEFAAREKALEELEQLRSNNRQLVRCVEALEDSRKEYESDAERYRQQADQSEKLSDTLRLKLDDLEKNFADIEKQQHEAIEDVRKAAVVPILRKRGQG